MVGDTMSIAIAIAIAMGCTGRMRHILVKESEQFDIQTRLPRANDGGWSVTTPKTMPRLSAFCLYTAEYYLDAHPGEHSALRLHSKQK